MTDVRCRVRQNKSEGNELRSGATGSTRLQLLGEHRVLRRGCVGGLAGFAAGGGVAGAPLAPPGAPPPAHQAGEPTPRARGRRRFRCRGR